MGLVSWYAIPSSLVVTRLGANKLLRCRSVQPARDWTPGQDCRAHRDAEIAHYERRTATEALLSAFKQRRQGSVSALVAPHWVARDLVFSRRFWNDWIL